MDGTSVTEVGLRWHGDCQPQRPHSPFFHLAVVPRFWQELLLLLTLCQVYSTVHVGIGAWHDRWHFSVLRE